MAQQSFAYYRYLVRSDLYRYADCSSVRTGAYYYLREPGFRYSFWMRTAAFLAGRRALKLLFWFACYQRRRLEHQFGINIPYATRVGPGLFIGHFGGIVVNREAVIGRNCNLSHGVTIGKTYRGKRIGCATIGDNVFIGPGAKILGKVTVGSNVAIGANAVVVDDVPDHAVVVCQPGQVISMKGSDGYIARTGYGDPPGSA